MNVASVAAFVITASLFGVVGVEAAPRTVTLQLKWTHQFQFAGYYAALERGLYRRAGFDVRIVQGGPGVDAVTEVTAQRATFGVGTSELVYRRSKGAPVVVLAVIYQHSPLALAVRGIARTVHALANQPVAMETGAAELLALLRREHASVGTIESVRSVSHSQTLDDLEAGRVAGMSVYTTDEPFLLDQDRVEYTLISPRTAGVDFYGDNLFTSEFEAGAHSADVDAFRKASIEGWKYALAHPEEMVDLILRRYPSGKSREHLLFEANRTLALVMPDVVEPGYMHAGRWQHILETYAEVGMLPMNVSLDGFMYAPPSAQTIPRWVYFWLAGLAVAVLVVGSVVVPLGRLSRRLQLSEQQMRQLIETAPVPIVVTSPDSDEVVLINARAKSVLATDSGVGARHGDAWPFAEAADRAALVGALEAGAPIVERELELGRPDGARFWAQVSVMQTRFRGQRVLCTMFVDQSDRRRHEEERSQLIADLERALVEIRHLEGILPICSFCKRIRSDEGQWQAVESYVSTHSEAEFSHGICPECLATHYPDLDLET